MRIEGPYHRLRLSALGGFLILLAGCATTPPPVIYGPPALPGGPAADPRNPAQGPFQPNAYLKLCGSGHVTNAPPVDDELWLIDFHPVAEIGGVVLTPVPVNDVCLSSGFGVRNGRPHEGIDLTSRPAGTIYAAAPGRIIEARVSRGYGNMILIDHGHGVYTRYAHLEFFDPRVEVGAEIGFGQPLGMMGNSGNATAVHLHFEVLTGDYHNPKRSKGLIARDVLSLPAWAGLDPAS